MTPTSKDRCIHFLFPIALGCLLSGCGASSPQGSKSCVALAPSTVGAGNGSIPQGFAAPKPLHKTSNVLVATAKQIRENKVVPASYIVAFRGDLGSSHLKFKGFRSEYAFFYPDLARRFLGDTRVKDIDYITSVNLAHPSDEYKGTDLPPGAGKPFFAPSLHANTELSTLSRLPWNAQELPEMPALLTRVNFSSPKEAVHVLEEWENSGDIWYAEPNELSELSQIDNTTVQAYTNAANNVTFAWHRTINLPEALATLAKAKNLNRPVIAVLDSGVDYEHPQLKGQIWENPFPGAAGCGSDVYGCDVTQKGQKGDLGTGNAAPYTTSGPGEECQQEETTCGHGTHVTGIIVAKLTENTGGVCPVCQVMPLKIIAKNEKGKGTASDEAIMKGLKYLVAFGSSDRKLIRIANSSFGKYNKSRSVGLLINVLKGAPYQTLVIGAAGNDDSMARSYPAAFSEAVAVASIVSEGAGNAPAPLGKNVYSNFGPWVDVAAPGGTNQYNDIKSTFPGGLSYPSQGTSMAAPVVAGVAGLVVALFSDISYNELRNRIVGSADPRIYSPNVNSGINFSCYNPKFGSDSVRRKLLGTGVIDAAKAVSPTGDSNQTTGYSSRVGAGCGSVGFQGLHKNQLSLKWSPYILWILVLTPLTFGIRRKTFNPLGIQHLKKEELTD